MGMTIECISCGQPMELVHHYLRTGRKIRKKYHVRRFKCPICDEERTINGNGYHDEELEPTLAVKEVNDYFKREEKKGNEEEYYY